MIFELAPSGTGPLHERIAGNVRRGIASGELAPRERLPTAKDLAAALDVNANTVLRAYRQLRDEGLVELRRGRGATITSAALDRSRLLEAVDQLVAEARRLGMSTDEVDQLVRERA
ncbi:MAG: GntR family transcriptional regulator [Nitriliruptoraceae bacterium]